MRVASCEHAGAWDAGAEHAEQPADLAQLKALFSGFIKARAGGWLAASMQQPCFVLML
jgi:hypothetical protein